MFFDHSRFYSGSKNPEKLACQIAETIGMTGFHEPGIEPWF